MSSSTSSSYTSREERQYFVPGYAISRHIIFSHIQYYLGPQASVRPYSYRGREGYLVATTGQPLTRVSGVSPCQLRFSQSPRVMLRSRNQSQIEDLQSLSRQYEYQAAERMVAGSSPDSSEELYINKPVQVQQHRRR